MLMSKLVDAKNRLGSAPRSRSAVERKDPSLGSPDRSGREPRNSRDERLLMEVTLAYFSGAKHCLYKA